MMSGKTDDVVIIGSGIASLTCAVLLAKRGKRVTVLEQYAKPGGYLHCFSRFGERYDTGAHYVGAMDPGHPFHTLLSYLGVYDASTFIPLEESGFDVFHFPTFTAQMAKGYAQSVEAISRVFPGERAAIEKFFALVRNAVQYFPTYEFNDSFPESPNGEIFETSLAKVVEGLTANLGLRCLLVSYCTLHGVQPEEVPFGFHALVMDSLIRSPYGLRHGGDDLAKRFVSQLEKQGGRLMTQKKVVSLKLIDRHVRQVVTEDGDVFEAEWVISGAHPKATYALCDDKSVFSSAYAGRLNNLKESVGLLGVSALTSDKALNPLRNYYFFDSQAPDQLLRTTANVETPPAVFLSCARRMAAETGTRAGSDWVPINIHSPAPIEWFSDWRESRYSKRPEDYKHFKNLLAEKVFDVIERYRPGFRASVQKFAVSTPLTNLHFNGSAGGSAYGIYHSIQNTGPRAIGPRMKVLNLLLTGQSCLFPGLLGAAISGLRTSGHVIGIKPLLQELKQLGASA